MISSGGVALRFATKQDRRAIYEWMGQSELTPFMMGPPLFPDAPIPTWEQFLADYVDDYFDGARPEVGQSFLIEAEGEAVGHVSYSVVDLDRKLAELDVWLSCEKVCGHGYGVDALEALIGYLHGTLGLTDFILRPSARNPRAIRAYGKAGFRVLPMTYAEQTSLYGPGDYQDAVVLYRRVGGS